MPGASWADLYTPLWEHKGEDIFYRTDHHWTSLGAYYGYTGLATALGYTPYPERLHLDRPLHRVLRHRVLLLRRAVGAPGHHLYLRARRRHHRGESHLRQQGQPGGGTPAALRHLLPLRQGQVLHVPGRQPAFGRRKERQQSRRPQAADNPGLLRRLLVPFLTPHFSEIHLLDLRYYKLSIADYIAQNGIDQALVLYSVPNFVTDSNLLWIAK